MFPTEIPKKRSKNPEKDGPGWAIQINIKKSTNTHFYHRFCVAETFRDSTTAASGVGSNKVAGFQLC